MEVGATYSKEKLHCRKYFNNLLERVEDVPDSVKGMLKLSRSSLEMFEAVQKKLIHTLREDKLIRARVKRLMSIKGVGEVMLLPGYWRQVIHLVFPVRVKPSVTVVFAAPSGNRQGRNNVGRFP